MVDSPGDEATGARACGATKPPRPLQGFLHCYARVAGATVVLIGLVVLARWWLGLEHLTSVVPRWPPMLGNTALMSVLTGTSLFLQARASAPRAAVAVAMLCAGACSVLAALTLAEHTFDLNLGIDQLVVQTDATVAVAHPGRPSPQTAAAFLLASAALLLIERQTVRGRRPAELLALAAVSFSLIALLGYLFGLALLHGVRTVFPYIGMAFPTAVSVFGVASGILAARADEGMMSVITAPDMGGIAARRVLLGILVFLPVASLLVLGERSGWYAPPVGSTFILFLGLVWGSGTVLWTAARLSRLDAEARRGEHARARLASLVESSDDAIIAKTLDGTVVHWNAAAERIYGYSAGEMVGESIFALIPPDRTGEIEEAFDKIRRGEHVQTIETVHQRKDGKRVPVSVMISPILDTAGRILGASAIARDISEQKAAEEALRSSRETERQLRAELQNIVDQMPEGVILLDGQGRMTATNQAAIALSCGNTGAVDLYGNPVIFDVRGLDGRSFPLEDLPLVRALRHGEVTTQQEFLLGQPGGRLVPITASAAPVRDANGQITGATVVIQDVSARKELERLREEWGSIVAHDLRQPVNAISLAAELLLARYHGEVPEKERKAFERIRTASARLNRMINDLLDASRIEAQRFSVECRRVDLAALIDSVIESLRDETAGHGIRVIVEPDQSVWIDPDRVHQVLANLISNAAKYGRPGTEIRIVAESRDDLVEVIIGNVGPGIPAEELPLLFSRFSRTRQARVGRTPGLGLGLYISKGLIEAHGGRLWAESVPEETTSFHFTVPRTQPNP